MVKPLYTVVTCIAMHSAGWSDDLTCVTKLQFVRKTFLIDFKLNLISLEYFMARQTVVLEVTITLTCLRMMPGSIEAVLMHK